MSNTHDLKGKLAEALLKLPPEQRADMNRFQQKVGAIMGDHSTPMQERVDKLMKLNEEMQTKYAVSSSK